MYKCEHNITSNGTSCFVRLHQVMQNKDECSWSEPLTRGDCDMHSINFHPDKLGKLCFMGAQYSNLCQLMVDTQYSESDNQMLHWRNILVTQKGQCNETYCKKLIITNDIYNT